MAYPTDSYSIDVQDIDRRLVQIKGWATGMRQKMAAGAVSASSVLDCHRRAKNEGVVLAAIKAKAQADSAFIAYIRAQKNNATLDVVAEFNAVISAVNGLWGAVETLFPASGGYLLSQTWGATGPVDRTFTSTQTASLRTALQAVEDSIG